MTYRLNKYNKDIDIDIEDNKKCVDKVQIPLTKDSNTQWTELLKCWLAIQSPK